MFLAFIKLSLTVLHIALPGTRNMDSIDDGSLLGVPVGVSIVIGVIIRQSVCHSCTLKNTDATVFY